MQRPSSTEWPIWHDDPWENPQPGSTVAPLRHELALARYLEKQRAWRASTVRRFDLGTIARRLCLMIERAVHLPHSGDRQLRRFRQFRPR